jgi:hypothetical protein
MIRFIDNSRMIAMCDQHIRKSASAVLDWYSTDTELILVLNYRGIDYATKYKLDSTKSIPIELADLITDSNSILGLTDELKEPEESEIEPEEIDEFPKLRIWS